MKVLILLDMNGTLILDSKVFFKCKLHPKKIGKKIVYLRPNYDSLLEKLLAHPKITVALYSSMILRNLIVNAREMLKSNKLVEQKSKLNILFDRTYNIHDPEGKHKHDTMRDLNLVWKDPMLEGEFGPTNTIMIDDDMHKVRNYKENAIVIYAFTKEHLINRKPNNHYYMEALGDYLVNLVDDYKDDIRIRLKEKPFQPDICKYYTPDPYLN